tara:strand:- start:805 stop:957 length:153 start_codon:yes stop_codon:yes gene_type:complete
MDKENSEDVFEAIREPSSSNKGPIKGTKGFSPLLLLICVVSVLISYFLSI